MKLPSFSSEPEEAAWWDTHKAEVEAEIRRKVLAAPACPDCKTLMQLRHVNRVQLATFVCPNCLTCVSRPQKTGI